jgi:hypothetical protein
MNKRLAAIAVLAVAGAVTLTAVAAAGQVAAQRVAIQFGMTGTYGGAFVLTPLTAGAVKADSGKVTFCCWTQHWVTRGGEEVEIDNPQMTLTGKHGTLVAQNRIGFVDLPDGLAVFTGTWSVVRGTGAYAGLSGGGRGAGVMLANSESKSAFQGILSPK